MGAIIYMDAYKLMQNLIKNAHFLKNECVYLSTHRAIDPCQKLNFYEISQVVPFLIAGHIYSQGLIDPKGEEGMQLPCYPVYLAKSNPTVVCN